MFKRRVVIFVVATIILFFVDCLSDSLLGVGITEIPFFNWVIFNLTRKITGVMDFLLLLWVFGVFEKIKFEKP